MATTAPATNATEKATLQSLQIPDPAIDWFQQQRKGFGITPLEGAGLYGVGAAIAVAVLFLVSTVFVWLTGAYNFVVKNPFTRILLALIAVFIVIYLIYYYFLRPDQTVALFPAAVADFKSLLGEGFQNAAAQAAQPDTANTALINLAPLTLKQAAYIGPKEEKGYFDLESGLQASVTSGIRSFVLQISALDAKLDPKLFAQKGEPTLVYRDDRGTLISTNGADLKGVAQKLADYAFNEQALNNDLPLVLYLHFTRTPNAVQSPEEYVQFLSKTAAALEPLFNRHLNMTGDRNYTRQQGELDLLRTPVKDLGQKVIYMTNVDTSLFRRTDLLGMTPFESKHDLDYLTHVRVYAATPQDVVGATAVAPSGAGAANAVLVSMRRILTMPEKEKDVFAQTHKTRFVIAMPGQMSNPPKKSVEEAMNRLGVNLVPLNLFGVREELKKTLGLWPNDKFLRTRPPALQVLSSAGAAAAANV